MSHAEASSRPPALFVPGIGGLSAGETLRLDGEEARHVSALRLGVGDEVRLTDGRGSMWRGRLAAVNSLGATCALEAPEAPEECPVALPVLMAFGVANKTHTLWLVEKATELGVEALQPIEFARSRSVADAARSSSFWSKAERRAAAALTQCGGAWLPDIRPPIDLEAFVAGCAARERQRAPQRGRRAFPGVLLDRTGVPLGDAIAGWTGAGSLEIVVGPEGGLLEPETAALVEVGFVRARLGRTVLRFETAAIAGAAVAAQHLEMTRAGEARVRDAK